MKLGWALPGTGFPQLRKNWASTRSCGCSNAFEPLSAWMWKPLQAVAEQLHWWAPPQAWHYSWQCWVCTALPGQESSSFAGIPPVQGQPLHPHVLGDLSLSFSCSNTQTLVTLGTLPGVWCPLGPPDPVRRGMWGFPGKACFLLASFVLGGGSCTCEQHVRSRWRQGLRVSSSCPQWLLDVQCYPAGQEAAVSRVLERFDSLDVNAAWISWTGKSLIKKSALIIFQGPVTSQQILTACQ